jgi:uncharacterized protein (UPF0335 family)
MSKSFEDIFVKTLLGRVEDRETEKAAIQVEIDELTNDVYLKGMDAGAAVERNRIIKLLAEQGAVADVQDVIAIIRQTPKEKDVE